MARPSPERVRSRTIIRDSTQRLRWAIHIILMVALMWWLALGVMVVGLLNVAKPLVRSSAPRCGEHERTGAGLRRGP